MFLSRRVDLPSKLTNLSILDGSVSILEGVMELQCLGYVEEVQDIQLSLLFPVQHLEHEVRLELSEVLL